jgi:phytoene synthase
MPSAASELVRQHDKDRFLASMFAPEDRQEHLLAVYAFAVEITRIPRLVSDPQIGEIRLQWWRDTIGSLFDGKDQEHPVASALAKAVAAHRLPIHPFINMIDARQFDLYADQMPSLNDLEGYLGETDGAVFQLASLVLDSVAAATAGEMSGLAGVVFGLARRLATQELVSKHIPPGETEQSLRAFAKRRLAELRQNSVPATLLPAFLPVALTDLYLSSGKTNQIRRQWRLWRAARNEQI